MQPLVSIITVNYNQSAVTEALLNSIRQCDSTLPYELIVVDNGSDQDPVEAWRIQYPAFRFIRSSRNLGFAGGNNLAIRSAEGAYLFLINNDTEVNEGLLEAMVALMERHPIIGMASPLICYHDQPDMIQYAGYTSMNYLTARNRCIGQFQRLHDQVSLKSGPTAYGHGAAMMVRREAILKAGLMRDDYFLYYEELDWCERIRKAGYEIWFHAAAFIRHKESVSVGKQSGLKEYYMNRNRVLFQRRHAPRLLLPLFMAYYTLLVMPRNMFRYIREKRPSHILLMFKAFWWNFRNPSFFSEA